MNGPLLKARKIEVTFRTRRAGRAVTVAAVRGIDLDLFRGQTLGLVGESGSGKSTLARALLKLVPMAGQIEIDGDEVVHLSARHFRRYRRKIQMVFQDPYSSLDPSMTVGDSIAEPLVVHARMTPGQRAARVAEVLRQVNLPPEVADRYPDEFSGGQRQRIAIARAIALDPEILICDEAVSALDISTQNQIIHLLETLQERSGLAYLFISHDLAVVRHISDRVAVMYLGEVIEEGPVDRIYDQPAHPYTQVLLNAVPVASPAAQRIRSATVLEGDVPDPTNPPPGCVFSGRCPLAMPRCFRDPPAPFDLPTGGRVRCHLHDDGPRLAGASVSALMAARQQDRPETAR